MLPFRTYVGILVLFVLGISGSVCAQIYKYIDRDGSVVYTNVPTPEVDDQVKAATNEARGASHESNLGEIRSEENRRPSADASANAPLQDQSAVIPSLSINRYDDLILKHSKLHEVDFNLVKAVIKAESNFNHRAVSPKGAKGLMQLMPDTARRYGVSNIFDPDDNIGGGVRYLKYLLKLFDHNLKPTLAAYNAGENVVQRVKGIPPYRETIDYVKRVTRLYGSETYTPSIRASLANSLGIYVYKDKDGVVNLTNIDPPQTH